MSNRDETEQVLSGWLAAGLAATLQPSDERLAEEVRKAVLKAALLDRTAWQGWLGTQGDISGGEDSPWHPLISWLKGGPEKTAQLVALLAAGSEMSEVATKLLALPWAVACSDRLLTFMSKEYEKCGWVKMPLPFMTNPVRSVAFELTALATMVNTVVHESSTEEKHFPIFTNVGSWIPSTVTAWH